MNDFIVTILKFVNNIYYPLLLIVVWVYTISGIDDLIFDLFFWYKFFIRKLKGLTYPKITIEKLSFKEQQKIAILIPAWKENEVIYSMLKNAISTIDYDNYDIFVGTYPNDLETQKEVDKISNEFGKVHKTVNLTPGPTTKADNLNNILINIFNYEKQTNQKYEIFLFHDAEDKIHPYSLKLYNYLIPRIDMVQIPVFPIPQPLKYITYWTYADEFSENHLKDLYVREFIHGFVPSAGVGTAVSRRVLDLIFLKEGKFFNLNALTEDYQFALNIKKYNLRQAMVVFKVENSPLKEKDPIISKMKDDIIATYEHFPTKFKSAVKQKTRWVLGIALQSWKEIGWVGNFTTMWNLVHDRKIIFTNIFPIIGYFLLVSYIFYNFFRKNFYPYLPDLIPQNTKIWNLIIFNGILMVQRWFERFYATSKFYGFLTGILSVPRTIWANFINFFAIIRAWKQFLVSVITGKKLLWASTQHTFPKIDTENVVTQKIEKEECSFCFLTTIENLEWLETIRKTLLSNDIDINKKIEIIKNLSRSEMYILIKEIEECLHDKNWQLRAECAKKLALIKNTYSATLLKKLLSDKEYLVRTNAIKSLINIGDIGIDVLLDEIANSDECSKKLIIGSLEQLGITEKIFKEKDLDKEKCRRALKLRKIINKFPTPLGKSLVEIYYSKKNKEKNLYDK